MLTGDEQLTAGEAKLTGYRLGHETEKFLSEIGYCPQFDAIIDHMTGKEMLVLFCRLRGILPDNIENETQKWIQFLGKEKHEIKIRLHKVIIIKYWNSYLILILTVVIFHRT